MKLTLNKLNSTEIEHISLQGYTQITKNNKRYIYLLLLLLLYISQDSLICKELNLRKKLPLLFNKYYKKKKNS